MSQWGPFRTGWAKTAGLFLLVFVSYAVGALLPLKAFGASELGPAFFPAAGVTVAALLLNPRTRWPAVIAAVALAEALVDISEGYAPAAIAGYALANSVEPLVGAILVLRWCGGRPDLRRRRDLLLFVVGACVAGPLAGGLIGGGAVAAQFGVWWPGAALRWFAADAIGVLVVASPILLWSKQSHILRSRPVETVTILGSTAALSWLAMWTGLSPSMLILPLLVWAALRLNVIGAALAGAAATVAANVRSASGLGMFSDLNLSAPGRLALIQVLIAGNVLLAMLVAQEAAGRRRAAGQRAVERQERRRLEALAGLARQLSAALTPKDVGRVLDRGLRRDAGAIGVNVGQLTPDGQGLDWVVLAGYPPAVIEEFSAGVPLSLHCASTDVVRTGKPILVSTPAEYEQAYGSHSDWFRASGAQSVAGWPLTAGDRTIGMLLLAWPQPHRLNEAQQAYFATVAAMVSEALQRAQSYTDERARASALHTAAHPLGSVDTVGLDYCALYRPAEAAHGLGGDWYSVQRLDGDRTYLAVGDVLGHGLTAVEDMAQLRSAGNAYAQQGLGPAPLLTDLSRFARRVCRAEFATTAVTVFDPQTAVLSFSSAGHPPPLLRRAASGEVIRLAEVNGPVLGLMEDAAYPEGSVRVGDGDVLVLYTDGLVEHQDQNVQAGIEHLERVIEAWPPAALLDCESLAENIAPSPHTDDVCLMVVRFGNDLRNST